MAARTSQKFWQRLNIQTPVKSAQLTPRGVRGYHRIEAPYPTGKAPIWHIVAGGIRMRRTNSSVIALLISFSLVLCSSMLAQPRSRDYAVGPGTISGQALRPGLAPWLQSAERSASRAISTPGCQLGESETYGGPGCRLVCSEGREKGDTGNN